MQCLHTDASQFNDGYGGGHTVRNNLAFNVVRETADHGPFNSWDRMPYVFPGRDGAPTTRPPLNRIFQNFFIHNGGIGWPIDHDDGSCYYHDSYNVLLCKTHSFLPLSQRLIRRWSAQTAGQRITSDTTRRPSTISICSP